MAALTAGIDNYVNAWAMHDMKLDDYNEYSNDGNLPGMEKALEFIRRPVETVKEYKERHDVAFEPDFTPRQEHRMNVLSGSYNTMISEDKDIQIDKLKYLTQRVIETIRKWANVPSSQMDF